MRRRSSRIKGKRYRLARQKTLAIHEARTGRPWSDRYIVTSITGWPINPQAQTPASRKPSTEWYVHDTAYAGQVVAAFVTTAYEDGSLLAERLARRLNMLDWEADHS